MSRTVETSCTLDLERTTERFHAHVELDGVEVGPGDTVLVHGAPGGVGEGQRIVCERRVTVRRAGWAARAFEKLRGRFAIVDLIETGFSPGRVAPPATRSTR